MNVANEDSISPWMAHVPEVYAPPLTADAACDVVVIGAGVAGLSIAYELAAQGRTVVVLDRGGIGSGMTARTTAHLASELDDYYYALIDVRGEDEARLYNSSQVAAINRIEAICRDELIEADFTRVGHARSLSLCAPSTRRRGCRPSDHRWGGPSLRLR